MEFFHHSICLFHKFDDSGLDSAADAGLSSKFHSAQNPRDGLFLPDQDSF
jgi:hypothetical protein